MRGYWVILRTELFGLFISPSTYVASFYFLALLGIGFRFFIESFMSSNWILPPLSSLVLGLIFGAPALIPFLTMRSFAEERRLGHPQRLFYLHRLIPRHWSGGNGVQAFCSLF